MKPFSSIQNKSLVEKYKGFIVGASEDGVLYVSQKKNAYILEIEQDNKDWLEEVKEAFYFAYNKNCRIDLKKSGYFRLSCYSKKVYYDLLETRKNPSGILKESNDFKIGFLQGIFDAEGSVHNQRLSIRFYSKKQKLITLVMKLLKEIKITTGKAYVDKRNNVIMLPIYGKNNLKLFQQKVNFNHIHKEYRLKNLLRES